MAVTDVQKVRLYLGEDCPEDELKLDLVVADAILETEVLKIPATYQETFSRLLACHKVMMKTEQVASEGLGSLSTSYFDRLGLESTGYGQELLRFADNIGVDLRKATHGDSGKIQYW